MKREMSGLQKWILCAALKNRKRFEAENSKDALGDRPHDLTLGEIKAYYFHLKLWPRKSDDEFLKHCEYNRYQLGYGTFASGQSNPGFPFSKWTTNLIKCEKCPDRPGFGWGWGGAEVERQWVRRKNSPFSSRSMPG